MGILSMVRIDFENVFVLVQIITIIILIVIVTVLPFTLLYKTMKLCQAFHELFSLQDGNKLFFFDNLKSLI